MIFLTSFLKSGRHLLPPALFSYSMNNMKLIYVILLLKKKKKKHATLLLWYGLGYFWLFFPPEWDVCQGFDMLPLYLCCDLLRGYNTQLFVTLLQGHRIGNVSITWHCSSQTKMIIAISDNLNSCVRLWTAAVRNRYTACLGKRARSITSYTAPVGNDKTCQSSQKL